MNIKPLVGSEDLLNLTGTYRETTANSGDLTLSAARQLDAADPYQSFKDKFHIPLRENGENEIYLCGNSLGLQPKLAGEYVLEELQHWQRKGVKGHFTGDRPWMPYHELLAEQSADLVGAKVNEVVMMNTLTVNLHLMMVSFYQPAGKRTKILLEDHAFPSDHYAVESQLKFHQLDPITNMLLARSKPGSKLLETDEFLEIINEQGDEIAVLLLPGVQYYTGQLMNIKTITAAAHEQKIIVGVDLAHAAGNVPLELHNWQVDFAVWCSYKYLNSGPGSVAGCFVHEKHAVDVDKIRFAGWWGHDKETRFQMQNTFSATPSAEGWQLSNPPILSLAAIRASLDTFSEAGGVKLLREKSILLTHFLELLLDQKLGDQVEIITPSKSSERGAQLSLSIQLEETGDSNQIIKKKGREVFNKIDACGITADWREPNVIRVAPTPLYNSFSDVYRFVEVLETALNE